MKRINKFKYPKSMRSLIDGKRHYDVGEEKLPSVTTILSATQSDEKKKSLADWRARIPGTLNLEGDSVGLGGPCQDPRNPEPGR